MNTKKSMTVSATQDSIRTAVASALRLEILGLFTGPDPLAIADMADLMGRPAGSLYHHVGILEKAGLLLRAGTRPKGKRHEALFEIAAARLEFEAPPGDENAAEFAVKTMTSAFRMAQKDLAAALETGTGRTEGADRNLFATRVHIRANPDLLAQVNKHLRAIEDLLMEAATQPPVISETDEHLALTLSLAPLKGRGAGQPKKGK